MKSQNKESHSQSNSSFELPSDLENDHVSEKEVDNSRKNANNGSANSQRKPPNIPNLDLSFPEGKHALDKKSNLPSPKNTNVQNNNNNHEEQQHDHLSNLSQTLGQEQRDIDKQGDLQKSTRMLQKMGSQTKRNDPSVEGANSNKSNQPQYRKMETDKTAPQSNIKSQHSPDRNPQSQISLYNNNASMGGPQSEIINRFSQNGQSSDQPFKAYGSIPNPQSKKAIQKQETMSSKLQLQNLQQNIPDIYHPNNTLPPKNLHRRGPSLQSIGGGPELTLDEDSYDNDRYMRDNSIQKEGKELFDDSLVSAIQNSGQNQFMDDADEEEEDSSGRRLIPDNQLQRSKHQQNPSTHQPQSQIDDKTMNQTKGINSTIGYNNTKELINFVDQSKDDGSMYNNQQFPILNKQINDQQRNNLLSIKQNPEQNQGNKPKHGYRSNKVAPIFTSNIRDLRLKKKSVEEIKELETDDYFQFDNLNQDKKSKEPSRNFKQSLFAHSSTQKSKHLDFEKSYNSLRGRTKQTTVADDVNESEQEISCLLDESQLKKQLYMPNLQGNKAQIQSEIGQIIQKDDVKFHEELLQNNPDDSFYRIVDKDSIEIIETYHDRCPCLQFRKRIMRIKVYINRAALAIITNGIFESVSIIVIVANSLFLALEDPLAAEPPVYSTYSDIIFQTLYTIEMILKILALGFVFNKGSYLRDSWNILDFIIVISGYLGYVFEGGGANLSVLRSFRVIRPLRTISSIQGLRIIVSSLVSSLPLLRDTILVLLFFFVIFAIAGVQLFSGELKNRCFSIETGVKDSDNIICASDEDCLPGQFCGKGNENPNLGATSFDNVFYAMLLIFQTVTLEGWTSNMIDLEEAVATWVIVYFVPIVFIGAFFLLNLTLAVIKSKFTEEMRKVKENKTKTKKSKIKKKRGVDDDSIQEENNLDILKSNMNESQAFREKIESMNIQQIEESKELTDDQKAEIKSKRKLEELIKKMEIAMKQKENQDKTISPQGEDRNSSGLPSKLKTQSMTQEIKNNGQIVNQFFQQPNYADLFNNKTTAVHDKAQVSDFSIKLGESIQSPLMDNSDSQLRMFKSQQRTATFKLKAEETIKEDDEESQDLTIRVENDNNLEGNADRRISKSELKIHQMIGIQDGKKSSAIGDKKQSVSSWLGQVFELDNKKENSKNNKGKLMMSGIAGIKNKQTGQSQEIDQRNKAAFARLQENFDIFEFLDADDEQFGDDELSNDEMSSSKNDEGGVIISEADNQYRIINHGIKPLERKSTVATAETKSFTKRNTLQRRSSRDNNQSERNFQNKSDTNQIINSQNTEVQPISVNQKDNNKSPQNNSIKRRQTVVAKHSGIIDSEEDEIHIQNKKLTFKQKALAIFKKSPQKVSTLNVSAGDSPSKQNNQSIKDSPDSQKIRTSKSVPRQFYNKNQNYSVLVNEKDLDKHLPDIVNDKEATVRAKSEHQKMKRLHKETLEFLEREQIMKERRNKFFGESIKAIGKSKLQLKKEKNDKILKKRFIQLGGGFQLASPNSPKYRKRKLLRSGTTDVIVSKEYEEDQKFEKKKPSFINESFDKEIKAIKEEVKKIEEDEEMIPDMEQILNQKKKKIALKMKNYKFSSIDDILETRDLKARAEAQKHGKEDQKTNNKKLQQDKSKKKKSIKTVKPFSKKIYMGAKKYHEDLDDIKESDDNQDDALKKLEDIYNKTHKSDIHVTGTLSIVFEKPKHENKMMNINYYYNIHPEQFVPSRMQKFTQSPRGSLNGSKQNIVTSNLNNNIYVGGFGEAERLESKESMYENNMSIGSIGQGRKRGATLRRSTTNISRDKRSGMISGGRVTTTMTALPRPEMMTDRQILRRLNNEVKKSRIFRSVNFKKLPDSIKRKQGDIKIKIKKPKKGMKKKGNNQKDQKQLAHEEEEVSDTSQENEGFDEDFYVDRDINNQDEVTKAKKMASNRGIDNVEWSGQDIMNKFDPYKARIALESLNKIRVWPKGFYGYFKRCRTTLKKIMKHSLMENLMTLFVFSNTIILSMDHYGIDPDTQNILGSFNTFFTIAFSCEMFLKILAIGIVKWLKDKMNYMDGTIVIMSLVELIFMSGNGALSAFRSVRMFRTLRVLRVARLLRGLKSMMNIISVIQRSLSSFVYLGMLLFLFIFIYALLGMQLFGGQFNFLNGSSRYNFDSFNQAFVTSFILLSMENWNQVLFYAMSSTVNKGISVVYFISCIFVGNFMLLNLFLAILLDAFTSVDEEDHETPEKKAQREKQQKEALNEKQGEDLILGIEEVDVNQHEHQNKDKNKKKKKKKKKKAMQTQNNILDESIEIDMEALTEKKEQTFKEKAKLFEGIECERSLYLFQKSNTIRIWSYKIVQNQKFENIILVLIIFSSIKLIYDTYLFDVPDDDLRVYISSQFDLIFTILFAGECVLKCISYGFIQDNNSYLRETWSQMDFFIVITSLIDAMFSGVNIPIIKILRLLRILRPLRFISHNSSMKTVVIALLSSMGAIFNVGIVVVCVFLMFAILGVNLFAGKLQYCTVDKYHIDTKVECFRARGEWTTYNQNFDNVIVGMLTLFSVATLEGWPDLMYTYTDINGLEVGPKPAASPLNAYFFVGFVFVGAFFFMNLFVGVLFMNFEAAQRDEKEALLLEGSEIKWVDMMKMIVDAKPEIIKIPKNKVSQYLYHFTKAESKFDFLIMICIILNMFQMAILFEGQTEEYSTGLDIANYLFTGIFTLECILKLIGNGGAYFIPTWHKFDFFVVLSSFLDIVMNQLSSTSLKFLRVGPQLARVLRVLRTITFSLPSLFNVFALLMLVYFIFAVLGVFMFRSITQGTIIDPNYMNFLNFSQAMIILLRISTGEDWPTIMYDTMNTSDDCINGVNCGYSYSPIFFIIFIMICSYVMLNLFVLIILQQFELYYLPDDNILQQFRSDLDTFKLTWQKFSKEFNGIRIKANDLVLFFKDLGGNLGFGHSTDVEIVRYIVKMNVESDEEGFVYFNELLFKAMKRRYGQERTKKKILIDFELKTLEKLMKIKENMITKQRGIERIKAVTYNPFLAVMYKNMSFRAWNKIYKNNLEKRKDEQEFGIERESSDEEVDPQKIYDDDFDYVTDQDVSCNEDDEFDAPDQDNSSKQLLGDKSVNALIQEFNLTPIGSIHNSQDQGIVLKNSHINLNGTPKRSYIEIEDQNPSPSHTDRNYNSGFKIKLQQTEPLQNQKYSNAKDQNQLSPRDLHNQLKQVNLDKSINQQRPKSILKQSNQPSSSSSDKEDESDIENYDEDQNSNQAETKNDYKNYNTTDPLQKE